MISIALVSELPSPFFSKLFKNQSILLIIYQLADVMISNTQEKVLKENGASNSEVVFYSFSIGLFYLGFALVATGQLVPAIQVAQQVWPIVFVLIWRPNIQ